MSASIAIPPISFSAISPVAFQLLTTGTSTAVTSSFDSASSVVDLSGVGLLLSTLSTSRDQLAAQQAVSADSSAASVLTQAQSFVDTFNSLQTNIASVQDLFNALPGSLLVDQLSQTLTQLATQSITSGSANLDSLLGIGITAQTSSPSGTAGTVTLQIDQNTLGAAIATDPAGTLAQIDRANQSLLAQLNTFEVQAANASIAEALAQTSLTQLGGASTAASATTPPFDLGTLLDLNTSSTIQGAGVTTDLLQQLTSDSVLNNLQLSDLNLAAAGLDASTLLAQPVVIQGSLSATLLSSADSGLLAAPGGVAASPAATTVANTPPTTNPVTGTASTPVVSTVDLAQVVASALPINTTATTVAASVATAAAGTTADTLNAERGAATARIELQNLLSDPSIQAIRNLDDQAYSAVIAASHLSDFVMSMSVNDPKQLLADLPGQVLPVERVGAVDENRVHPAIAFYRGVVAHAAHPIMA